MKKKNSKISLTLIIVILISFIILVYYITRQVNTYQPTSYDQSTPTITQSLNKTHTSKDMEFSMTLPDNSFKVNENLGSVTINTPTGNIY